jgi:drug/metabolite transporter (DMT)-like permease
LQPLLATLMAIPLLDEQPTKSLMMGGGLVLTGVFLAERG